ncbi:MIT C-terminal domain-containing protein [Buchananella felis]|uniref:MIT C-terminal domain-containing protein n=1 Tax=Buchananella felis TaxID=3231492 RepID=UPI003528DD2E
MVGIWERVRLSKRLGIPVDVLDSLLSLYNISYDSVLRGEYGSSSVVAQSLDTNGVRAELGNINRQSYLDCKVVDFVRMGVVSEHDVNVIRCVGLNTAIVPDTLDDVTAQVLADGAWVLMDISVPPGNSGEVILKGIDILSDPTPIGNENKGGASLFKSSALMDLVYLLGFDGADISERDCIEICAQLLPYVQPDLGMLIARKSIYDLGPLDLPVPELWHPTCIGKQRFGRLSIFFGEGSGTALEHTVHTAHLEERDGGVQVLDPLGWGDRVPGLEHLGSSYLRKCDQYYFYTHASSSGNALSNDFIPRLRKCLNRFGLQARIKLVVPLLTLGARYNIGWQQTSNAAWRDIRSLLTIARNVSIDEDLLDSLHYPAELDAEDRSAVREMVRAFLRLVPVNEGGSESFLDEVLDFAVQSRVLAKEILLGGASSVVREVSRLGSKSSVPSITERRSEEVQSVGPVGRASTEACSMPVKVVMGSSDFVRGESGLIENVQAEAVTEVLPTNLFVGTRRFEEDQVGVSYERLFSDYFHGVKSVRVVDPYVRHPHQVSNLAYLIAVAVQANSPVERLEVSLVTSTSRGDECEGERARQLLLLDRLVKDVKQLGVVFSYSFDSSIHDRSIQTDNGWVISLGRGLDIFKGYRNSTNVLCYLPELSRVRRFQVTYQREETVKDG